MRILRPFVRYTEHLLAEPADIMIFRRNRSREIGIELIKFAVTACRTDVFTHAFAILYPRPTGADEFTIACKYNTQFQQIQKDGIIDDCFNLAISHDAV